MEFSHTSVLLEESIASLDVRQGGVYVDATAGGGGHSAAILERLTTGRLIAVDRDPDAVETLKSRFAGDSRVSVVNSNYSQLPAILLSLGLERVDGVLADLGVSSYQLDAVERGFSFHNDAPLDMRMSKSGVTAGELVNTLSQQQLSTIIFKYGEEKFARQIARAIVAERGKKPIETTLELVEIIKSAIPAAARRTGGHPARRTFQALRIEVNGELDKLEGSLNAMFDALNMGGRLSVITFHSLEDRVVKQTFSSFCVGCTCPPQFPVCVCGKTPRAALPFKSISPGEKELQENPRSRSARLRCVRRVREDD